MSAEIAELYSELACYQILRGNRSNDQSHARLVSCNNISDELNELVYFSK